VCARWQSRTALNCSNLLERVCQGVNPFKSAQSFQMIWMPTHGRTNAIGRIATTGRESIPNCPMRVIPAVVEASPGAWRLESPCTAGVDQEKKSTFPLAMSYIAPTILIAPFALSSLSTRLPFWMLSMVSSTFLRATASTKALFLAERSPW